ncbi:UNVERIFIED_CONTAM: hypothetical protein NCL1_30727 [Trichonephila clavipes]
MCSMHDGHLIKTNTCSPFNSKETSNSLYLLFPFCKTWSDIQISGISIFCLCIGYIFKQKPSLQ